MTDGQHPGPTIPEATRLFRLVVGLSMRFRGLMDARLADIDLTMQQAAVLTFVEGRSPGPTQGQLAEFLGTSHQNVRQLLDVLVRKKLVRVGVDVDDRRVRRVTCTPRVKALFADRDADDHAAIREWLSGLTDDEIAATNRILEKAWGGLHEGAAVRGPP